MTPDVSASSCSDVPVGPDSAESLRATESDSARNSRVIQERCSTCRGSGYSNEVICRSPVAYRPCRECNGSGLSRPDPIAPGPGRGVRRHPNDCDDPRCPCRDPLRQHPGGHAMTTTCPHGDRTCLCATRDLFQRGNFTLHSGKKSTFLINCAALSDESLAALAEYAVTLLPPFSNVVGIPRGGLRLQAALDPYAGDEGPLLLVDDVLTSGGSMAEARADFATESIGLVIFARGECPDWITPLFTLRNAIGSA